MLKSDTFAKVLKKIIRGAKFLFTPIAFSFLGFFIWESRVILFTLFADANINWLLICILLWMLLHLISALFSLIIFKSHTIYLNYKTLLFIHCNRLPAKYLPGGIWHTVARSNDYYKKGISTRDLSSYLLIENIMIAAITLIVGGFVVLGLIKNNEAIWYLSVCLLIFISFASLIMLPWVTRFFILKNTTGIIKSTYFGSIFCILLYWLIAAVAFVSYLHAFKGITLSVSEIEAGGIYIFSWGIGFITLFAPQGIGVAEFISAKLLTNNISTGAFIALLASFRMIGLIADLTVWLLSFLLGDKKLRS